MRINIVGTSGSGKSTLGKQLSAVLKSPYYEMDSLFWKQNWEMAPDDELFAAIENITSQPNWILDGNYNRTASIKWANVDLVVWVDYSLSRTFFQAVKRALLRCLSKEELWVGTGNTESFKRSFLSRDSVLLWTLTAYKNNKLRYEKMMNAPEYAHIEFVRLTSPKQKKEFIKTLQSRRLVANTLN